MLRLPRSCRLRNRRARHPRTQRPVQHGPGSCEEPCLDLVASRNPAAFVHGSHALNAPHPAGTPEAATPLRTFRDFFTAGFFTADGPDGCTTALAAAALVSATTAVTAFAAALPAGLAPATPTLLRKQGVQNSDMRLR